MMQKLIVVALLMLLTGVPILGQETELTPWQCPEGFEGQQLNVYNWAVYIAEDTIANFEAACGVRVTYDTYESNEFVIALLRQGNPGYDIIVPTDYAVQILINEDLLLPLDLERIPNIANINPALLDLPFDPGNRYSVPYQWGTVGFGYRVDAFAEPPRTWDDIWNFDGDIVWLDDPRGMLAIALNILGYDVNTIDPDEIAAARDYLLERGSNVVAINAVDGQARLERGEVDGAIMYSGNIFRINANCQCDDYAYVIPEPGSNLWLDNLAIPVGAPNPDLAHVFIDYILDPQVGADISNYLAYGSPNQAAIDAGLIDPELLANPAIYPSPEVQAMLYSIIAVPEAEVDYLSAWDEIKVSFGI
jgi:spermidine/putrescine transport system substrate-binding protein